MFLEYNVGISQNYYLNTTGFNQLGFIYLKFILTGYGKMTM